MPFLETLFFGLFGLCIGSFLNVLIARLPLGQSVVTGASQCMNCGTRIRRYDLVPILSYFVLRGKCRSCGQPISLRYPAVELLTGLLFVLLALRYPSLVEAAVFSLFAAALIAVGWIDCKHGIIPNSILIFIVVLGGILTVFGSDLPIWDRVIGLFCVSVPLLVISLAAPNAMGMGDVKLMAAGGLVLGWQVTLFSFLLGAIVAAVYGLIVSRKSKHGIRERIPFGPFLSGAMITALFVGRMAADWYFGLIL